MIRPSARERFGIGGLDFADAAVAFEGITVEIDDVRNDYGERRVICFGTPKGRLVVVGYPARLGKARLQRAKGQRS